MPGQPKKSKVRIPLVIEKKLARAVELDAARHKSNRTAWITEAIKDKLDRLGKLP